MFVVSPNQITKMQEGPLGTFLSLFIENFLDISPNNQKKKVHLLLSSEQHHGDNQSLTGWTNVNSLNASGIAQESIRCGNRTVAQSRPNDGNDQNPQDKVKEECADLPSISEAKRKLYVETIKDKSYEESLRSYPKNFSLPKTLKAAPISRASTINMQDNEIQNIVQPMSQESPTNLVNQIEQRPHIQEGNPYAHALQIIQQLEANQSTSPGSKNFFAEIPSSTLDFRGPNFAKSINQKFDRRGGTTLKKRHHEPFNTSINILNNQRPTKFEEVKKNKNLRLSKALSFWSPTLFPQTSNNISLNEMGGFKCLDISNSEAQETFNFARSTANVIPTKFYNFMGNKQEVDVTELKPVISLQHSRSAMRLRRPLEEQKIWEYSKSDLNKNETTKMRTTHSVTLYTKNWETANGFKRKSSRNIEQFPQTKRKSFNESYGRNMKTFEAVQMNIGDHMERNNSLEYISSKNDKLYKMVMEKIGKATTGVQAENKDKSLDKSQEIFRKKSFANHNYAKMEPKIEIDGVKVVRYEKGFGEISPLLELTKRIKEGSDIKFNPRRKSPIKYLQFSEKKP